MSLLSRAFERAKTAVRSIFAAKLPEKVWEGRAESDALRRQVGQYSKERKRGEELKGTREDARLKETKRVWEEAFKPKEPVVFEPDPLEDLYETDRKPGPYEGGIRRQADGLVRERNDKVQAYEDMVIHHAIPREPFDWMYEGGPNPPSVIGRKGPDLPLPRRGPGEVWLPYHRPTIIEESIPDNRTFGKKVADKLGGLLWWRKQKAPSEVVISRKWKPKAVPKAAEKERPKEPAASADAWLSDSYKSDFWKLHQAKNEYERRAPMDALADLYSSFGLPKDAAGSDYADLSRRVRSKSATEALDLVARKIRLRAGTADGLGALVQYGRFLKDGYAQAANNRKDRQRGLEAHRESIQRLTNQAMDLRMKIEQSKQKLSRLEGQLSLPELTGPENNPQLKSPLEKEHDGVMQQLKAAHGAYAQEKEESEWVVADYSFQPSPNPLVWDGIHVNPTQRDEDNLLLAKEFIEKASKEPLPPARPMVKGRDYDREIAYRGPRLPGPTYDSNGNRIVPPLPKQDKGKSPLQGEQGKSPHSKSASGLKRLPQGRI